MIALKIDPKRTSLAESGIYVRAQDQTGEWGSHDIAHLDRESLLLWMRLRGCEQDTVLALLGHESSRVVRLRGVGPWAFPVQEQEEQE